MALVVEDGSCIPTANAFVSRQELIDYKDVYFPTLSGQFPASNIDAAIARASAWVSAFPDYFGKRTCGRAQGLSWPRTGMTDCDGNTVPDDEVPLEVKRATLAAAIVELQDPNVLTPTITPGSAVRRERVADIEQEFMTPVDLGLAMDGDPIDDLRPMIAQAKDFLKCFATFPNDKTEIPHPFVQ